MEVAGKGTNPIPRIHRPRPIRVFYSQRRSGAINFGDDIAPVLISRLLNRDVQHARVSACDIASIGSIVEMIIARRMKRYLHGRLSKIIVWGSGCLRDGPDFSDRLLDIRAFRGPNTAARFGVTVPFGDPGILFPRLVERKGVQHKWGIVAHYTDKDSPVLRRLIEQTPNAILIPVDAPPLETLARIASCEHIASSSLHGLVAADAYGIPNWRIELEGRLDGGNYKFIDYCLGIGRNPMDAIARSETRSLDHLLTHSYPDNGHFLNVPELADKMEKTLFETYG